MQTFLLTAAVVLCMSSLAFSACPAEWKSFNGHCYKFQAETLTWPNARVMCRIHKSDLIKIETPEEQEFYRQWAHTYNHTTDDEGFWLGATDWEQEGKWVWELDTTPLTYSTWGLDQPNNRDNAEHCLASVHYFDYSWSDDPCNWQLQYVCEMDEPAAAPIVG